MELTNIIKNSIIMRYRKLFLPLLLSLQSFVMIFDNSKSRFKKKKSWQFEVTVII